MSILIGSDSSGTTDISADYIHLGPFTAVKTGTSAIFVVHSDITANVRVAIYNDDSDTPGTLNTGNEISQSVSSGRNELVLSGASITNGTKYWLAAISDTGGGLRFSSSGGAPYRYLSQSYSGWSSWLSTMTGETGTTGYILRFSIYEASGGGFFTLGTAM